MSQQRRTDEEVLSELRSGSLLNLVRVKMISAVAAIDQADRHLDIIEIRRRELEAAEGLLGLAQSRERERAAQCLLFLAEDATGYGMSEVATLLGNIGDALKRGLPPQETLDLLHRRHYDTLQLPEGTPEGTQDPIPPGEDMPRFVSSGTMTQSNKYGTWAPIERVERLAEENARLRKGFSVVATALVEALRNAGDIDSFDVYELCAKSGLTTREPFDPDKPGHQIHDFVFEPDPGDEICLLTPLGRKLTAVTGHETRQLPKGTSEDQPPPEASGDSIAKS